jgi:hypothetical protein
VCVFALANPTGKSPPPLVSGWSRDEIWRQLKPNGLPDSMTKDRVEHTLFICEDRWYWTNADLHYKDYCFQGCQNRGSGKDDACHAAGRKLAGAADGFSALNGTSPAVLNGTVDAASETATSATAAAKRTAVLRA